MKTLIGLKSFMKAANIKSVEEWNKRRELAKESYSQELISQLDASAYIHELLHK